MFILNALGTEKKYAKNLIMSGYRFTEQNNSCLHNCFSLQSSFCLDLITAILLNTDYISALKLLSILAHYSTNFVLQTQEEQSNDTPTFQNDNCSVHDIW